VLEIIETHGHLVICAEESTWRTDGKEPPHLEPQIEGVRVYQQSFQHVPVTANVRAPLGRRSRLRFPHRHAQSVVRRAATGRIALDSRTERT
jgi:hypothetical protein